jgi:ribonuclease VapC
VIAVDTSAIIAVYIGEPEAEIISRRIAEEGDAVVSAGTLIELSIVTLRLSANSSELADDWLDRFLLAGAFRVEPVTLQQADIARHAYRRFGKGMGHPAQLNFGDCFSYALAKSLDIPLLFKGTDFGKTDIASAL